MTVRTTAQRRADANVDTSIAMMAEASTGLSFFALCFATYELFADRPDADPERLRQLGHSLAQLGDERDRT